MKIVAVSTLYQRLSVKESHYFLPANERPSRSKKSGKGLSAATITASFN
jgi:hypothetical protein